MQCDAEITILAETYTSQPGTIQAGKPGPGSPGPRSCRAVPVGYVAPGAMRLTAESAQASPNQFQSSDTYRWLI